MLQYNLNVIAAPLVNKILFLEDYIVVVGYAYRAFERWCLGNATCCWECVRNYIYI